MKSTINDIKIRSFNNVDEIINFIKILDKSKIIYLSGSVISKNIPNITRHIIYETEYQIKIDENIIEQIKFAQIDHVMIFSALNFKKLIHIFKTHDILSYIKYSVFICISKNLAEIVKKSSLQACYVEEPNQNNMIKLITQYERK
jgi:uroporphyrinogen-III synthase